MLTLVLAAADLLLFAAAFWIAGRAGATLAGKAWPSGAGFADQIALGMGVWMVYVYALAATHALVVAALVVPLLCAAVAASVVLVARRSWRRRPNLRSAPESRAAAPRTLGALLWAVGLVVVLGALFVRAAYPALSWDAAVYHLAVPKRMLAAGGFTRIPLCFESLWPLNMQLLYGVALAWRGPQVAALLHWGCGALLLLDMASSARRAGMGAVATSFGAALMLLSPVFREEMGIAYVDLAFALFFWLAFAAVRRALAGEDSGRNLIWAGVLLGLLSGIKLTGIVACLALAALWSVSRLLVRRQSPERAGESPKGPLPSTLGGLLRLAIPVVLLVLPWHLRLWQVTGNPVYPFAYERFGGIEWSPRLAGELAAYQNSTGFGRAARDYLLLPARLLLAPNLHRATPSEPSWLAPERGFIGFDGELGRVWLLALPLALWACRRQGLARAAAGTALVYLVAWSLLSQQMRFVLPVLPMLAIAAACGAQEVLAAMRARSAAAVGQVVLAGLSLAIVFAARGDAATARRELAAMQTLGPELTERLVPPVYRYLNAMTPADARILFVNTNKGYYCDRDYIADGLFEASQVADWLVTGGDVEGVGRLLRSAGVTHVVIERVDWGIVYPPAFVELLADPARAAPVFQSDDGRFTVLEVR